MCRFQNDVRCAALGGLFERIRASVLSVPADAFDYADLLAARRGVHDPYVRCGLGARGLASRCCGADEHEPGRG